MPETAMNNVIPFRPASRPALDPYFGVCPYCGGSDGYLNVREAEWAVCHRHQVKWLLGGDLFSDWRNETEADWQRNSFRLSGYVAVAPDLPGPARPHPLEGA